MARRISVEIVGDSRSVERAFSRAGKAGGGFGQKMRSVGKAVSLGFGGAVLGAGLVVKRGLGEIAESQKVAAQTNAVLKSTGAVAGVTGKHVDKLATRISRKSGIDDEAVASAENLLLTFTKIRNGLGKGNKVFDKTTQAVVDMSVAMGMDLDSAALLVGKSMNQMDVTTQGNVRGFMALRRVGVQVTPMMMKQAAAFIKAGKPMEAQKLLLQELQTEFGGSAAAFGETMPGAMGKLNVALDNITGAFAEGFLPIIQKVSKFLTNKFADPAFVERVRALGTLIGTKLYNAFAAISKWFQAHWGEIKSGFATGAMIAQRMAGAVRRIYGWFQKLATVTPGGEGTLLGIILGGVLLAKLKLLGKALRAVGFLAGVGAAGAVAKKTKSKSNIHGWGMDGDKKKPGSKGGWLKGGLGKLGSGARGLARGVGVGFGLSQSGQEIPWNQQALTGIGNFAGAMKLARKGKLSKKALAALSKHLTPKQMKILRRTNAGGGRVGTPNRPSADHDGNIVNVYIDGKLVESAVTRRQQRKDKSTAASRRGRHGGVKR